ncbi:MAG: copper oxidase [Actinobacteria bacterium 13_2_20CM_2_72_6]|nr:MAG: copper oxidase [Actinobacteria bacterium 13_2_20CM_2_72_6]
MSPRISRRGVLSLAAGVVTAAGVGGPLLTGWRGATSAGALLPSRVPLPRPFQRPLPVPPVLAPVRTDATTDYYEVTQRVADAEILPGLRTQIWGYNGIFPGPTLVSRSGRRAVVKHRNELPVPVVVHLHGGHTPPAHDGYPIDLVLPVGKDGLGGHNPHLAQGDIAHGEREYVYPLDQRAATLWYHDHRMDFTGPSTWRGLAGFHLLHDDEEERLGLPTGERDVPLMITDRSFAADGAFQYPSRDPNLFHEAGVTAAYTAGVLGDVILVNGVAWPVAEVPAVRYRLRLLNASNARRYRLALDPPPPGGGGLVQVGTDGGLLERPLAHDAIEVAPGQRYDVVVDFSRYRAGQAVTLVNEFGAGSTRPVLRFVVGARATDGSRVPDRLSSVPPLDPNRAAAHRDFAFHLGRVGYQDTWLLNGKPFDPARADATPRLGDVEVWRLRSDFHHPIHLHLVMFQVLARDGRATGPYDAGWKDTVDVRPNEWVDVAARFTGYAGRYPVHCHNLEHEDMAMMGNFVTH